MTRMFAQARSQAVRCSRMLAAVAVVAAAAGCFDPSYPEGRRCTATGRCPGDLDCSADGFCIRPGPAPDGGDIPGPDARPVDAGGGSPDASEPDAAPGPTDAAPREADATPRVDAAGGDVDGGVVVSPDASFFDELVRRAGRGDDRPPPAWYAPPD